MNNKHFNLIIFILLSLFFIMACNFSLSSGEDKTPSPPERPALTVDDVLATCPTAAEITAIDANIDLQFDADPTAGEFVCTAAAGSADLTHLQERAYQALVIMRRLSFSQPLPWTNLTLFDWFINTIDGIRFRDDIEYSFCCEPNGYINVSSSNLAALETQQWISPYSGTGLNGLMILYVHEARHHEVGGHTCGNMDNTIDEMNAWGVQYYLNEWLAWHTTDPNFFYADDITGNGWYNYNLETAYYNAIDIANTRFCEEEPKNVGTPPALP
ncbi:MAG: hypothetical protein ACXADB_11615 [Candidatus Hermodarchaeia archaeon]|jgi:hypothetical protein